MAEVVEIPATARPRAGKGAARAVRRQGKVPAVIYGEKKEPETIALDANELWKVVQRGRFLSTVLDINVDGQKRRVLPREIQLDPVKDLPIHVDFQRVGASDYVRVVVPVRFINEGASPGLKRGGVLNIVRHEIEVTCPPDRIPEAITVDLTGLRLAAAFTSRPCHWARACSRPSNVTSPSPPSPARRSKRALVKVRVKGKRNSPQHWEHRKVVSRAAPELTTSRHPIAPDQSTFPGLSIPFGSNAALIRRIKSISTGLL